MSLIHETLNKDILNIFVYFHQQASHILTPYQIKQIRSASIDLISNVHNEMLQVRSYPVPSSEHDEHYLSLMRTEHEAIKKLADHFLHQVENIITID